MAESAAPLLATLRAIVGDANVLTAENDVAPFSTDWRDRYRGRPRAVVRPVFSRMGERALYRIGGAYWSPPLVHRLLSPRAIFSGEPWPMLRSNTSP